MGPHDPTGRFTYWPLRVAQGGDVLAPAPPERRVQFVDVRDLGDWLVHVAEERIAGTFNAVRPAEPFGDLLEVCREVSGSDARFVWVDESFLLERDGRTVDGAAALARRAPRRRSFRRTSHGR